jgi:AcrR family transcriptional regulator
LSPVTQNPDERLSRIVTAALEVFSEFTFRDATTDEIARRARVSKRDIYAAFPRKHALLTAVIKMVLEADDENLTNVILLTKDIEPFSERLEVIGLALINELLSPATGFLCRLISSESMQQPQIGAIYFENWYARRGELMSEVLSPHIMGNSRRSRREQNAHQAAKHYVALVTHQPQFTVLVGMRDIWNAKSVQAHVKNAVECFLRAYPPDA